MKNEAIRATVLGVKIISNVSPDLVEAFNLLPHQKSLGIITADIDDVTYTALDEATKAAEVDIVYAKSMYAGSANASTKLAGEVIGIMAGPSPAEVRSGLNAAMDFIESGANFVSANDDNSVPYFAHCVSRTGSYLSKSANVKEGEPLAYLIAPPLEAIYALDAALKAADVELVTFYGPPSETNFGGALLTGSQSACQAACDAFAAAVQFVAENPTNY
ncbi:ethanolamine utilization microcompartment protein EutL [Clostridium estertheticum]|uniref:Ethanolamine utilization microcompartment protein EutL n=1 Tax=Clostridium estertheticum TaxID=238834 RepID=A0A5N7IKP6_9CLOT|nr:ethanolamine utilization microcompartment protein EutL [Clostridium estertheticum]MCB2339441.1 ethanolamine utilization microcompartment protein EutL [Clostridium estertheticum]MPQ30878.1 ethanolamine utilization microcompartment protein EutL [Clostridium estertheticum]MPQ61554.1 ethanolamine utilization microcompartment protein EutL [Clostridium estertheticum]